MVEGVRRVGFQLLLEGLGSADWTYACPTVSGLTSIRILSPTHETVMLRLE